MREVDLENKKYTVTVQFEVTLQAVTDYADADYYKMRQNVKQDLNSGELIKIAADHISEEVMGYHEEEDNYCYDYLKFDVTGYNVKDCIEGK